ncbi:unnamed protein product [Effrenium voratum]|nr:unnamed protein product [Effrenium voratum]
MGHRAVSSRHRNAWTLCLLLRVFSAQADKVAVTLRSHEATKAPGDAKQEQSYAKLQHSHVRYETGRGVWQEYALYSPEMEVPNEEPPERCGQGTLQWLARGANLQMFLLGASIEAFRWACVQSQLRGTPILPAVLMAL